MLRGGPWHRPTWFDVTPSGWVGRCALAPLAVAAGFYARASALWRTCHERGPLRRERLACRVISVGSLSVGGTAKTPLTARVAELLRGAGASCAVASRGYGRRGGPRFAIVSDGGEVRGRPDEVGDEPLWLATRLPGTPVLVGADRAELGRMALAQFSIDVLILDDGLQHHRLARDVDLLTVDGGAGLGNGWTLPRGPLREPIAAAACAHAVVVTDGPLVPDCEALLRAAAPRARWFAARRKPISLHHLGSGEQLPLGALRGREVGLLCGIALPESLRRSVRELGAQIGAERIFPDHHRYAPRDVADLGTSPRPWITTEKDAIKLDPSWIGGGQLLVLSLALEFAEESAFAAWLRGAALPEGTGAARSSSLPGASRSPEPPVAAHPSGAEPGGGGRFDLDPDRDPVGER